MSRIAYCLQGIPLSGAGTNSQPVNIRAGWEGISGKNYIGPRNISEIRRVVEGPVSEQEPVIGVGEPPAWYSDQQASQEPGQATGSIIMTRSSGKWSGRLFRKR